VRRHVSSIATFHRAAGVANPCDGPAVKLALKRMHRALGRAQKQAAPVSDGLVERMLAAAGTGTRALRNKAMLVVAYTTMTRRSELVALLRADLQVEPDGFGTIVIRRGKTDQEGAGAVAPVTSDAMRHLLAWTDAAGIDDGPLFRAVLKGGRIGGALDAGEVARIFKAMARAAGLSANDTARISGPARASARRRTCCAMASSSPESCRPAAGKPPRWSRAIRRSRARGRAPP
jgi:integrase